MAQSLASRPNDASGTAAWYLFGKQQLKMLEDDLKYIDTEKRAVTTPLDASTHKAAQMLSMWMVCLRYLLTLHCYASMMHTDICFSYTSPQID